MQPWLWKLWEKYVSTQLESSTFRFMTSPQFLLHGMLHRGTLTGLLLCLPIGSRRSSDLGLHLIFLLRVLDELARGKHCE